MAAKLLVGSTSLHCIHTWRCCIVGPGRIPTQQDSALTASQLYACHIPTHGDKNYGYPTRTLHTHRHIEMQLNLAQDDRQLQVALHLIHLAEPAQRISALTLAVIVKFVEEQSDRKTSDLSWRNAFRKGCPVTIYNRPVTFHRGLDPCCMPRSFRAPSVKQSLQDRTDIWRNVTI